MFPSHLSIWISLAVAAALDANQIGFESFVFFVDVFFLCFTLFVSLMHLLVFFGLFCVFLVLLFPWRIQSYLVRLVELAANHTYWKVRWISRSANEASHQLAGWALKNLI